ncbi:MAG: UPF0182 family protein [Mycobacteriaceae bacterium]
MGMRPAVGLPNLSRRNRAFIIAAVIGLALLLVGPRFITLYTDWLWFNEVNFSGVFSKILVTRLVIFILVAIVVGLMTFAALAMAYRTRPVFVPVTGPHDPVVRYRTAVMSRLKVFALGIPVTIGVLSGFVAQSSWSTVQLFLNGTSFGIDDPQFHLDIGFYAFDLPFYRLILNILFVTIIVSFILNLLAHYIFGGIRLAAAGGAITRPTRIQLAVLAGVFVMLKAIAYWFDRYELLFSDRKENSNTGAKFTGASYTDINAVLPAKLILLSIAVICALAFFAAIILQDLRIPALATALLVLSSVLVGAAWPLVVEQFSVKPNAPQKESEYIARNIDATKQAYGLTDVNYEKNWGTTTPDLGAVAADQATLSNLRLLDPNILSPTFTQQQRLRNMFGFPDQLSVDRYEVDGKMRDFVVAARELNPNALEGGQKDWINRHTVYTHGNGFIAARANQVDEAPTDTSGERGGYPIYSVNDLASTRDPNFKSPIPVDQPRIYFGELIGRSDPDYAIVGAAGSGPREYDDDGVNFTYDGSGGVPVGNMFNRVIFSLKYTERNFLLSDAIGEDSKIIFNRDPRDRVKEVAPWLTVDSKTYPVVIDKRIKWVVDGYTTLDNFPYAQRMSLEEATTDLQDVAPGANLRTQPNRDVAYIRNSVKAVVDAYDGSITLYQQDDKDPVLKAWMGVFPDAVQPKSAISTELADHFRYPEDLFKVQRELLTKYHLDNTQAVEFFNSGDFWSVPSDPRPQNTGKLNQPPYYVVAADPNNPGSNSASFQLTSVMRRLSVENLAAYMTVSSDPQSYGKITVRQLPTSIQTDGPKQVQDKMLSAGPVASARTVVEGSSEVKYGNLLTLPVGKDGLLYVEPLYTQAKLQKSAYPKLYRVLVYFNGNIGFEPTIGAALQKVGISADGLVSTPTPVVPPSAGVGQEAGVGAPPTSLPGNPDGLTQAQKDAVAKLGAALNEVRAAQASGDFDRYGKALAALDEAVKAYQAVQG